MEKEQEKEKRNYNLQDILYANWVQGNALRQSPEYREFYQRAEKEYHQLLNDYHDKLASSPRSVHAGKFMSVGPSHLVKLKKKIDSAIDEFDKEAQDRFGISLKLWILQDFEKFFSPDEEWPSNIILFPDYP
ncbi:MAG: hypothetical protein AB1390_12430 [Nitrospirota bacterium]